MANLMPNARQQFLNTSTGTPMVNGYVYTYEAGTTTPKATYTTAAATVQNANPVRLNARGEATIFWDGSYYIEVHDANDVLVYSQDNYTDPETPVTTLRSDLAAPSGSSLVTYTSSATDAQSRTVESKLDDLPSVYDFFIAAESDSTSMLQRALDSNQVCFLPRGQIYDISDELIIDPVRNRNSGFIGVASWSNYSYTSQTSGPTWDGTKESIIRWTGAASATSAMIRASSEVVGTEPASTFDDNIYGFTLHNILLDGNSLVGFGMYGVRMTEPDVYNCCVRGTTKHAWYINGNYSGQFSKISAVFNDGCGISFGRALLDYTWSANYQINGTVLDDLYATTNGGDKTFDESTNPLWGYGIGLWLHRGNTVTHYTSELNDGAALVLGPTSGPNVIGSGANYSELNSQYSVSGTTAIADGRATRGWGLWFVGQAGGASLSCSVGNVFMSSEGIRLTGTEPSSGREQQCLKLINITGATYLDSDWANYALVNCANELETGVTGTSPNGAFRVKGRLQDNIGGLCAAGAFSASTGAIVLNGTPINCTITYSGVGLYDVSLGDDMADTTYTVVCPPGATNRVVAITSKTTSSFRISHTTQNTAGTATDSSSTLAFAVIGVAA